MVGQRPTNRKLSRESATPPHPRAWLSRVRTVVCEWCVEEGIRVGCMPRERPHVRVRYYALVSHRHPRAFSDSFELDAFAYVSVQNCSSSKPDRLPF